MSKKFFTDKDIEELFHSGVTSLRMDDDVVLTDLAFEKARTLGLLADDSPPAAPVRPYLSEKNTSHSKQKVDSVSQPALTPASPSGSFAISQRERGSELEKRIREKVAAKLGNQVDPQLLDAIIKRTLKVTGMK